MKIFYMVFMFFVAYVPALVFFTITPYITRRTESFGISIPEDAYSDPEVKSIRDNYRNVTLIFGGVLAVFILAAALIVPIEATALFIPAGTFIQLVLTFILYISGHKRMKLLKAKKNWTGHKVQLVVVDTGFRMKRMLVSPLWFALHLLIVLATVGIGVFLYDKLPDSLPMHWNINGEVDRWVNKSYRVILLTPFVQTFLMIIFMIVYWIIGKAKQQIDASNPESSLEQSRKFRYRWSAFTVFTGLAMIAMFCIIQFSVMGFIRNPMFIMLAPTIVALGVVAASIVLSITTGQGGSRISTGKTRAGDVVNRDDDKYWKLGMFYYNPDDPALFVEKRFGIGWTSNFARPASWAMVGGFVILMFVFVWITTAMSK